MVLADFGCARRLGGTPPETWGTDDFRCPEMVASTRADVYSVGECLRRMWQWVPVPEPMRWTIPVCVSSAISLCMEHDPLKRPRMGAICNEPAWENVPVVRVQYLRWPTEYHLRMASWYSYHTSVRANDEPLMQVVFQKLHHHLLTVAEQQEVQVADGDWF